jgi:hypothetical protein
VKWRRRFSIVSMIGAALLALYILLSLGSQPSSDLSIEFQGHTNTSQGLVARLRLGNSGATSIRLNSYCTLYWTNRVGIATNRFYQYSSKYVPLDPGEVRVATVPPPDARIWYTSFGYEIRPNVVKRIYNHVRGYFSQSMNARYRYAVRLGPSITNSHFVPNPIAEERQSRK